MHIKLHLISTFSFGFHTVRLANFAQKNEGANVIYLCSKVDEHVTSVFYDVQRR